MLYDKRRGTDTSGSSVQFKVVSVRLEKPICAPPLPVSQKFPQRCRWNVCNVLLIDDGPLSSYLGGSFSASSFNASLLQAINGVVSLALCPHVVSQVPQHFRSSEKQATCEVSFFPPGYLLGRFSSRRHVQGSTPTGNFEGGY